MKTIEGATLYNILSGDRLTWKWVQKQGDMVITEIREGIAHHCDESSDWYTKDGRQLTHSEVKSATLTVRRLDVPLPEAPMTVIVPNDGCGAIEAMFDGIIYRTKEAMLEQDGKWHGIWRSDKTRKMLSSVASEDITPGLWKVDDQWRTHSI